MQYFDNISFHISPPNNKKLDIFKIYTKWAVEKCLIWNFQTPRKSRNSKNKSGHCFAGHPVYPSQIAGKSFQHNISLQLQPSCLYCLRSTILNLFSIGGWFQPPPTTPYTIDHTSPFIAGNPLTCQGLKGNNLEQQTVNGTN